jgi:catechol O-methyltransferase
VGVGAGGLGRSSGTVAGSALAAAAGLLLASPRRRRLLPRWLLWTCVSLGTAITANELSGKPVPLLRWSFLRMVLGMKRLTTEWQVGDGREAALAEHVVAAAPPGDVGEAIRVIDDFARHRRYLINVGDEKGEILDAAVRRVQPGRVLEIGTYCGYSGLRIARAMPPDAQVVSLEINPDNAAIARRVWAHAGVADRVTVVVGTLDDGETLRALREEHGFTPGSLDLVFLDHDKDAYLPDLQRILDQGWLHPGSVVVADNVAVPGAPAYRAYMAEQDGARWRTTEHRAHVEYQSLIKDLVLESEYLGG